MTARKPKPKPRKASKPTLEQRVAELEETMSAIVEPRLTACREQLAALETRDHLRDKSHDEPVSNVCEAIGHFTLTEVPRPWWRRFLDFMEAP